MIITLDSNLQKNYLSILKPQIDNHTKLKLSYSLHYHHLRGFQKKSILKRDSGIEVFWKNGKSLLIDLIDKKNGSRAELIKVLKDEIGLHELLNGLDPTPGPGELFPYLGRDNLEFELIENQGGSVTVSKKEYQEKGKFFANPLKSKLTGEGQKELKKWQDL